MNRFLKENRMLLTVCLLLVGVGLVLLFRGSPKPPDTGAGRSQFVVPAPTLPTPKSLGTVVRTAQLLTPAPFFSLLDSTPVALPLGMRGGWSVPPILSLLDGGPSRPFIIDEKVLSHHGLILGNIGTGKSRLAELICRFLIDSLRGFCFIDPHGDTAENLLAYAMKKCEEEKTDAIVHQLHFIELSFETVFGFDPFRFEAPAGLPPGVFETAYRSWLDAKVDQFLEIVQINNSGSADFSGMARLQRVLRDCVYAVGVALNDQGEHLPLSQIFAVLDCDHKYHRQVFDIVKDKLPIEIRCDIERWQNSRREDRLRETESTINRLRSLLSPLVQSIFSDPARSIPFRKVVRERGIMLVSIRKSDFLSAAQRNAIASLFIHEIWSAAQTQERKDREDAIPYYLFIDEAPKFVSNDIAEILAEGRKFKLSIILLGQHINQFKRKDVDLIDDVLTMCRSVFCFEQRNPKDLHLLQEWFHYPSLNLEPLMLERDRQKGLEEVKTIDRTRSKSTGTKWDVGLSASETDTKGTTNTSTKSQTTAIGTAKQEQEGQSTNHGNNASVAIQRNPQGHELGRTHNKGDTNGGGTNKSKSESENKTQTNGSSESVAHQNSHASATGIKVGFGGNESETTGESEKTQLVPKMYVDVTETGKLRYAINDQFYAVGKLISSLPTRHAMARIFGDPAWFIFRVGDVPNVFPDPQEMATQVKLMKKKIYELHEFYYTPDLSPASQLKKFGLFLARVKLMHGLESRPTRAQEFRDAQEAVSEAVVDDPFARRKK